MNVPSVTSTACPRCGRLDYPHVCQPRPTGTVQPKVTMLDFTRPVRP